MKMPHEIRLEETLSKERESLDTICEFRAISRKYHTMIDTNTLLRNDFRELSTFLGAYGEISSCSDHTTRTIDAVILHLLSEVSECATDEERMDDEGSYCADITTKAKHRYHGLKLALDHFHDSYTNAITPISSEKH